MIGGSSLFGGRGEPLHAPLGGLVVATVYNGFALMGIAAGQYISTAIVLLAAVTVDALARRRATTTGAQSVVSCTVAPAESRCREASNAAGSE